MSTYCYAHGWQEWCTVCPSSAFPQFTLHVDPKDYYVKKDSNVDLPFCVGCPDHAECMQGMCYLSGGPVRPPSAPPLPEYNFDSAYDEGYDRAHAHLRTDYWMILIPKPLFWRKWRDR